MPQLYDVRKVEELFLKQLKIPDGKDLLLPAPKPNELNAVNENIAATMQRPIVAFPEQDHLAHIQVHLDFITNPMFGGNRLIGGKAIPFLLEHLKEHLVLWYANQVFEVASDAVGADIGEMQKNATTEEKQAMDKLLAATANKVGKDAEQTFAKVPEVVQQAIETLQSFAPPPQMPPNPQVEVAKAEIERKTAADQANQQLELQKLQDKQREGQQRLAEKQADVQARMAELQQELEREQLRQAAEDRRTEAEIRARIAMNEQDNQTAKQLAALEVASGERIAVSTGTGINPQP
jgi:flagellar biosynthesis GTPase FlhF